MKAVDATELGERLLVGDTGFPTEGAGAATAG